MRQSEKGDATAVIFAALVVALMVALGVIFYQNFIGKNAENTQPTATTTEQSAKMATSRMAFNSTIYALEHPEDWKAVTETPKDAQSLAKVLTVTSPDSNVAVTLSVGGGGLGGRCDPSKGYKVRYHKAYAEQPVENLIDKPVYLVEAMSEKPGGGYRYHIGLVPDGGELHASEGDAACTTRYIGLVQRPVSRDGKLVQPLVFATITFPNLPEEKISSMDQVKTLLATDDYKTAVTIIQSARRD